MFVSLISAVSFVSYSLVGSCMKANNHFVEYINSTIYSAWDHNELPSECPFIYWKYGGAITFDGIFSAVDMYYESNTSLMQFYNNDLMSPYMYEWLYSNESSVGYAMVHNITVPFSNPILEDTIGDFTGIMPIMYIDQIYYNLTKTNQSIINSTIYNNDDIWYLIWNTIDYYILQWPRRLESDGTISRNKTGEWNETSVNNSMVWADDCYMGLTLMNRLIRILSYICFDDYNSDYYDYYYYYSDGSDDEYEYNYNYNQAACDAVINSLKANVDRQLNVTMIMENYINFVTRQVFLFNKHLNCKDNNGIFMYAHGYNDYTGDQSCCPWGRANGWILLSKMETIKMIDNILNIYNTKNKNKNLDNYLPFNKTYINSLKTNVTSLCEKQLIGVAALQNTTNGLWHQVINDNSTFIETSCSAMFTQGMIFGKLNNIVSDSKKGGDVSIDWDKQIKLAMNGLLSNMTFDNKTGKLFGVCNGTAIKKSAHQYDQQSTDYCGSGDPGGPGLFIAAIVEYQRYIDNQSTEMMSAKKHKN